jgi:hypothetical protein
MYKFFTILVLGAALMTAGCQTTDADILRAAIQNQTVVIVPPDAMFNCPGKPTPPSATGLTDKKVAKYLVRLDRAHTLCFTSMQSLRDYIGQARIRIERDNKPST